MVLVEQRCPPRTVSAVEDEPERHVSGVREAARCRTGNALDVDVLGHVALHTLLDAEREDRRISGRDDDGSGPAGMGSGCTRLTSTRTPTIAASAAATTVRGSAGFDRTARVHATASPANPPIPAAAARTARASLISRWGRSAFGRPCSRRAAARPSGRSGGPSRAARSSRPPAGCSLSPGPRPCRPDRTTGR